MIVRSECRWYQRRKQWRGDQDCVGTIRLGKPSYPRKGAIVWMRVTMIVVPTLGRMFRKPEGREHVQGVIEQDTTDISNCQKNASSVHTSPMISEVCGFQHNARLSLPQDSNKSASCLHQDNESTPFSCPVRIFIY